METDSHQTRQPPASGPDSSPPITMRDVLRAIFLPDEAEEPLALALPPLPTVPRLLPRYTGEDAAALLADAAAVLAPASVDYAEQPVELAEQAGAWRMAALAVGTVVTILIAYMAQTSLMAQGRAGAGTLLMVLAGLAWLGLLVFEFGAPGRVLLQRGPRVAGGTGSPLERREIAPLSLRGTALVLALPLMAATYLLTAGNTFTPGGVIVWLLSVTAVLLTAAERSPSVLWADGQAWLRSATGRLRQALKPRLLPLVALAAILATAAFFRFYRLDAVPAEMTSDHVEKLLDAYDVSQGIYHVFFTRNGGREAIQFYLVALAAKLFGRGMSFLTLKLVSALEGLALVPLMILLGRELIDRETGFLAAALVAVAWWDVALSRLALRIVLTPFVFTLLLVTLVRGIRTGSRRAWLWAGVWLGIGVYAYQALRIAPLVAAAAWLAAVAGPVVRAVVANAQERPDAPLRRQVAANTLGRQTLNLALAGLVALALFVPMLRVWHDYPNDLWNRVINRTTESERSIEGRPLKVFTSNYGDALRMFNVRGDVAWISAVPGKPMLDRITGGLFVLGLLAWGVRLFVRRDPADAFVVVAGLIMLLPSALALAFPIENPSATRASGTLPIVFLVAAWPLALVRQRWTAVLGGVMGKVLSGTLVGVLLVSAGLYNFRTYFTEYNQSYRGAALNPSEVAAAVRSVIGPDAALDGVWLVGWPYWHDYRAIGIEAGDIGFSNAIVDSVALGQALKDAPGTFSARPLLFIIHPDDEVSLALLREHFPQGEAKRYRGSTPGRDFVLFLVPAP